MALALKDRLARQASGDAQLTFDPAGRDEPHMMSLPLRLIDPDPNQPRKDHGKLADLALSIREQGLLQPLIVEAVEGGRYRILVGERRFVACRSIGLETVPCIVRTVAEQSRLAMQLIENLHRKGLHPLEEARALQRLKDDFNLTQADLAKRLGKSPSSISETLRILDFSAEVLADIRTSEQTNKSVLLEIAKEPDPIRQRELLAQAQAGELPVRQARVDKGKPRNSSKKARRAACTIAVAEATVVIEFKAGEGTPDRVRAALEEALQFSQNDSF